jgi:hypothetical protein
MKLISQLPVYRGLGLSGSQRDRALFLRDYLHPNPGNGIRRHAVAAGKSENPPAMRGVRIRPIEPSPILASGASGPPKPRIKGPLFAPADVAGAPGNPEDLARPDPQPARGIIRTAEATFHELDVGRGPLSRTRVPGDPAPGDIPYQEEKQNDNKKNPGLHLYIPPFSM